MPELDGEIGFSYSMPGAPINGEFSIVERAVFSLIPKMPQDFEDLSTVAHRLTNFLCFALDQTVSISNVRAQTPLSQLESPSGGDEDGPWVTVVYESLPFTEKAPTLLRNSTLFRFPQVRATASKTFGNWFRAYELLQPALDLYFSARTGAHRFINGRFLSLAQALETFHRRTSSESAIDEDDYASRIAAILRSCPDDSRDWLTASLAYGNELSLASRLKRMIEPFADYLGTGKHRKKLVRDIVEWRNFLTHYDVESAKATADSRDLFPLCLKIEALLQLHWLKILGFSGDEIARTVRGSYSLQSKLELDQVKQQIEM